MILQDMKPGPELDALIAEKVMGGKRHFVDSILNVDVSAKTFTIGKGWEYPPYSTDIAAAWEVVHRLWLGRYCVQVGVLGSVVRVHVWNVIKQVRNSRYRSLRYLSCCFEIGRGTYFFFAIALKSLKDFTFFLGLSLSGNFLPFDASSNL